MGKKAQEAVWAIGLISGTSMDGVDAALIRTDGKTVLDVGPALMTPYEESFREQFRGYLGARIAPAEIIETFTRLNAEAVLKLIEKSGLSAGDIAVVGFHGQTLFHDAPNGVTVQVGDGQLLSDLTGIDVVADFRSNDVQSGGEGAPFAPLYHRALAASLEKPLMVLNLGGVANVTYMDEETILAFDTGPASAMIDDWVLEKAGLPFDDGGAIASKGQVQDAVLAALMDNPYFAKIPPKSLDRDDFSASPVAGLSLEDGAATLTAFTVKSVAGALEHCPERPQRWLVTGGGRKNQAIVSGIAKEVDATVEPVEVAGWRGDELEAEAFAFLAVRSLQGLPLSLPTTTGVSEPMTGGIVFSPDQEAA